jgi:hypothetical protein
MPRFDPRQLNRSKMFSQGLLAKGQGQGLFGPNIQQGGVGLGPGRNTLIGPNPAATKAMGSAINRFAPRGTPTPTSPRVMNTGGTSVADLFKGAKLGQFGARVGQPAAPMAGYDQFGPQAAQVQQVQGGPPTAMQGINALGTAAGTKVGGMMDINPGFRQLSEDTKAGLGAEEGPEGFMGKVGGFFNRTIGEKGSGKRSDIGRSMMSAGAAMMKGSPDGTFATIGQGLETGLGGYQALKEDRRVQEDREIKAEDRATTLENRDTAGAAVEAMVASMPPEATVEIAAMRGLFAEGDAAGALKMGDVYLGRINYTDAIDELGGTYLTPDKLRLIKAMPPETGFAALYEALDEGPAIEARAQALVSERGWTLADAMKLAVDGQATDAILRSPVGGGHRVVESHGENYIVDMLTGKQVGDTFGESDMPLRWSQLEALKGEAEVLGQSELLTSVTGYYDTLKPKVDAMDVAAQGLEILLSGDIEQSKFNEARKLIGELFDTEESVQLASLENILKGIGISNLSMFVGAISEQELKEALALAGNINDMHATLSDILARNMEATIHGARQHNDRVERLIGSGVTLADEWDFNEEELEAFEAVAQVARAAGGQAMLERTPEFERLRQLRYGDGSGGLLEAGGAGGGEQTVPVGELTAGDAPTTQTQRGSRGGQRGMNQSDSSKQNERIRAMRAAADWAQDDDG